MPSSLSSFLGLIFFSLQLMSCAGTVRLDSIEELPLAMQENKIIDVSPELLDATLKSLQGKTVVVEFSTRWCEICKSIYWPLQKLARKSNGQFVLIRLDVTDDYKPLFTYAMKPAFPGFWIRSPELKEPIRKYGGDKVAELENWLLAGAERPFESPLTYAKRKQFSTPKVVLVAGSRENANFSFEVTLMRKLFLEKGMSESDIECFYVNPDPIAYLQDREQFDGMKKDLAKCHEASREDILEEIKQGVEHNKDSFYLYVSSHGHPPAEASKLEKGEKDCWPRAPSLVLDAGLSKCEAERHLTPEAIAAILPKENSIQKIMIFNGCYTGGFISSEDEPEKNPSVLAKLSKITLLTASRSDRASFGCDAGQLMTVFGAAFLKALASSPDDLKDMDWKKVYETVDQEVSSAESQLKIRSRSEPQFFQSK